MNARIHGLWHDEKFPDEFCSRWASVNHCPVKIWTFAEASDFVLSHLQEYRQLYDQLKYVVEKSAFLRYALIYLLGGVYMDLDIECREPLDFSGDTIFQEATTKGFYQDCVFGSYPRNPVFKEMIERRVHNPVVSTSPAAAAGLWGGCLFSWVLRKHRVEGINLMNFGVSKLVHHSQLRWLNNE